MLGSPPRMHDFPGIGDLAKNMHDICVRHLSVGDDSLPSVCSGFSADLKPRMPSPIPFPNSGSFFGPNTSKAIPKMTSKCIG